MIEQLDIIWHVSGCEMIYFYWAVSSVFLFEVTEYLDTAQKLFQSKSNQRSNEYGVIEINWQFATHRGLYFADEILKSIHL